MSAAPEPPSIVRKRTSLEPAVVSAILALDNSNISSKPNPPAHIGSPSSQRHFIGSLNPSDSPFLAPREALGFARTSTRASKQQHAVAKVRSRESSTDDITKSDNTNNTSGTETNFLAILAKQERLVLELKEQLQKAEEDLKHLKKQWALQEVNNRRSGVRKLQQLKPLSATAGKQTSGKDDTDGSSAWMYEEMERRKALMGCAKTSQRRVFTGSRQARPLSLLVTDDRGSLILEPEHATMMSPTLQKSLEKRPTIPQETNPLPVLGLRPELQMKNATPARRQSHSPHRDDLIMSGKQIAADIKDGFWTFFEDLRQATVGEEASSSHNPERRPSRIHTPAEGSRRESPARGRKKTPIPPPLVGLGLDAPAKSTVARTSTPKATKPATARAPNSQRDKPLFDDFDDGWDTWPSPTSKTTPARSSSTVSATQDRASPVTAASSRTSTSSTAGAANLDLKLRDNIPWPALEKLHPGHLRRTASHLMDQWERSLSPGLDDLEGLEGDSLQGKPTLRTPSPMEQQALL